MTIIRVSGFIVAVAIHGLLFALAPPVKTSHSSAASNDNLALSISYLQTSTTNAAPPHSESDTNNADQTPLKQSVPSPLLRDPSVVKQDAGQSLEKVTSHVIKTRRVTLKKTEQHISSSSTPTTKTKTKTKTKIQSISQGIHQKIISKPLFSSSPTPPQYPRIARQRGQQGTVWVDVLLDEKGRQTRTEIYQSSGISPLDRAALDAVRQWQFIAHRIDDIAVTSYVRIPVEFSLE